MESRLPHTRRAIRTDGYVLRVNKLASHLSDDDEHHIPMTSDVRMVLHLHGRRHHSHKTKGG